MLHILFFLLNFVSHQHQMHCERTTRHYTFNIKMKNITRLCHTKTIPTVNDKFPGPQLLARDGDRVIVKVTNQISDNVTLHWHGVRQLRNGWADGPAYITQCPIQTGQTYTYNFTIEGQRGTLLWHAHISWLRSTIYGAIVIVPKENESYPFEKPHGEVPIILGEWWKSNTEDVIKEAIRTGGNANASDAYTINGKPGPLYNCSSDTFRLKVDLGKNYLLRIINAALNVDLFFGIANHTLIVVEADGGYVKPFKSDIIHISAGQTINAILKTKPRPPNATFFMLVGPYATGAGSLDKSVAAGILHYNYNTHHYNNALTLEPTLPSINSTMFVFNFSSKFHSLKNPILKIVDKRFFFTVGLGILPCPARVSCKGPYGAKLAASINNMSFALPSIALLHAYYYSKSDTIYSPDFPQNPVFRFNYTGSPPEDIMVGTGTRVVEIPFNTSVEVILQDTSILGGENHPLHLHGFNFFVVGQGFGNFDSDKDPDRFNLVDPVERNTVGVPLGGWVAIRFLADNPGVWFMHCHFEIHLSWGLRMAWSVLEGSQPEQKMLPPPLDLPKC